MTQRHKHFFLDINTHHCAQMPGILDDTPITICGGTMSISAANNVEAGPTPDTSWRPAAGRSGPDLTTHVNSNTLCRWAETDLLEAIHDLESKDSIDLGIEHHVDVMQGEGRLIYLALWHTNYPRPVHVITLDEDDYYMELADARLRAQCPHP